MGNGHPAHDTGTFRHQTHQQRGLRETVPHHTASHAGSRRHHQLRRCRAGGRTHPAMGDAESATPLPGAAAVDLFHDRRGHPRRLRQPQAAGRLPITLRSGSLPCHRRLALRHERHPPLYTQIPAGPAAGTLYRSRADPHTGHDSKPPAGNQELQARAILGALHRLPRHTLHPQTGRQRRRRLRQELPRTHHQRGRRAQSLRPDKRPRLRGDRHQQEEWHRGTTQALRPHKPAGGMQQKVLLLGRGNPALHTKPLREEIHHLPPCRYHLPARRYLSQVPQDTAGSCSLRTHHPAPYGHQTQKEQKGLRLLQGD